VRSQESGAGSMEVGGKPSWLRTPPPSLLPDQLVFLDLLVQVRSGHLEQPRGFGNVPVGFAQPMQDERLLRGLLELGEGAAGKEICGESGIGSLARDIEIHFALGDGVTRAENEQALHAVA